MTSYVALYRKYRPHTFKDVVGQEQVVDLLVNSIKQNKISHAYLFCGGRGTGKTSVARIVAREIGCNPEDIIEIDAASNRGIDEIRELREAVRTAPFSSPYKIYIIDEAHMLTKEASNALLKTLEEPPSHVIFVLATTDPEKLPATIVSRCQKVTFKNPSHEVLSKQLTHVAEQEGFTLNPASATLVALHGKGSYRDALGILEQVLAVSDKKIDHEQVRSLLGSSEPEFLFSLAEALCKKDAKTISSIIASNRNKNALRTYDELIELVRQGLLSRVGGDTEDKEIAKLASEFPLIIGSKLVLGLLEKRHLLEVSDAHAWTAFEAILVEQTEL